MAYSDIDVSDIATFVNQRTGRAGAVLTRDLSARGDVLRCRMSLLGGCDKDLMEMYLEGISFRQIASIAGVNEATVARQVRKICKRLMDATYITCLRNRDTLGEEKVQIACDLLVKGMSRKEIARTRNISLYRVRKVVAEVMHLAKRGGHVNSS